MPTPLLIVAPTDMICLEGYTDLEGREAASPGGDVAITMRLAAVVGQDGQTVVGLAEGPKVVIWETSGGDARTLDNPGFTAAAHRRMTTLKMLLAEGVEGICTPPQGFCRHSYEQAVRKHLRFIPVQPGTAVATLQAQGEGLAKATVTELGEEFLAKHHHRDHGHHHEHPPEAERA